VGSQPSKSSPSHAAPSAPGAPSRTCPRCDVALTQEQVGAAEVDSCPECGGVWLDAGEVQQILGTKRALENYVPYYVRQWRKGTLPCPVCGRTMLTLAANKAFPFDLDQCPHDAGYWVDAGELDTIRSVAEQRTYRLKERKPPVQDTWRRQELSRKMQRVEQRMRRPEYHQHPAVASASYDHGASFSDLGPAQLLLALIGVPVEEDRFYRWSSFMNLLLVAANVAIFVLMMRSGRYEQLVRDFGFVPAEVDGQPTAWTVNAMTAMFVHGGVLHLVGNMLFLFITGDDVERRMGHAFYPIFYFLGGLAAMLASFHSGKGWDVPHVGASGAISAIMGAYMVLCYYKYLYFRWWFHLIAIPAWVYLLFWFGMQYLEMKVGGGYVDYAAHIGGFVFGVVGGGVVSALQRYNPHTGEWERRWLND